MSLVPDPPPSEPCPDCGAEWCDKASACTSCGLTIEDVAETLAALAQISGRQEVADKIDRWVARRQVTPA